MKQTICFKSFRTVSQGCATFQRLFILSLNGSAFFLHLAKKQKVLRMRNVAHPLSRLKAVQGMKQSSISLWRDRTKGSKICAPFYVAWDNNSVFSPCRVHYPDDGTDVN